MTHTAKIEKMSYDGRGLARIEGKATFIDGALPGETVKFDYIKQKRDFAEGIVVAIETAATTRVEPTCPHYAICGGCTLQHLDATAQIYAKQDILLDILSKTANIQVPTLLPPLMDAHWHYRSKARLSVRYVEKKHKTLIGFREKLHPRYIAEIHTCHVLREEIVAQMQPLAALIDGLDNPRTIAQIEVAAGDQDLAFILRHLTALTEHDLQKLTTYAKDINIRLFLQPDGIDSIHLLYPQTDASVWLAYKLPDFGINFQFHPTDFTQINFGLNRKMVTQAIQLLQINTDDCILDLFCGLGNFSLPMAKNAANIVGIEGNAAMVQRAYTNAQCNNLSNVEFLCANLDAENALSIVSNHKFTKILLDPPRTGAYALMHQLGKLSISRIVYVSCNPITLARDAKILVHEYGYKLIKAGVMDMFPHTAHVESMVLFER